MRPIRWVLFVAGLSVILSPSLCFADMGIPMLFIGFPMILLCLIPIIAIETIVFNDKLRTNYVKTLKAVGLANVITTIIGYPFSWALLLGLQLLTRGNSSVFGTETLWRKVASVTLGAAWLSPSENDQYWMVPVAGMVGLIPAFFISVYLEYFVVLQFFYENKKDLLPLSWKANLITYILLIGFLFWSLFSRFFSNL